jgi:hypothetical protein
MPPSIRSYAFILGCLILVGILFWDVVDEWNLQGSNLTLRTTTTTTTTTTSTTSNNETTFDNSTWTSVSSSTTSTTSSTTTTTTTTKFSVVAGHWDSTLQLPSAMDDDDIHSVNFELYNTEQILRTIHSIRLAPARLLIYHPSNELNETIVTSFTVAPSNVSDSILHQNSHVCLRCRNVLPLLVDLLLQKTSNHPMISTNVSVSYPIQFLYSAADYTTNVCLQDHEDENSNGIDNQKAIQEITCHNTSQFAPWLHFGSGMRDSTWLPTFRIMPVTNYLQCIKEWRLNSSIPQCMIWKIPKVTLFQDNLTSSHPPSDAMIVTWDSLIPKIIWRGTGFPFLPGVGLKVFQRHNSTYIDHRPFEPRRVASDWTYRDQQLASNMSENITIWLDAAIVAWKRIDMTMDEMALKYKYYIDFGGAGGTSWTGTLTKLAMPGLLFHHETPTMDWFYDYLLPWYHYVPIRTDLSDLRQKYDWAESHPKEARAIAEHATQLAHTLLSNRTLKYEYERLQRHVQGIIHAYQRSQDSLATILKRYRDANVTVTPYATCTREFCDIQTSPNSKQRYAVPKSPE